MSVEQDKQDKPRKRPYTKPKLVLFGSVRELTKGVSGNIQDFHATTKHPG